jgi:hypothetical protein
MSAQQDLATILGKLKKSIIKNFSSREMQKIASFIIEEIKDRSRKGYGVDKLGGSEEAFDSLSPDYIARRRKMKLSPFTKPSKSNITRSGRMLAGLRYKVRDGDARIEITGTSREGVKNSDIAQYVQDNGRPFMTLSKYQLGRLYTFIEKEIINISV